jgi:hypothetical protein
MVTVVVLKQPVVDIVYVIVAVPAETPPAIPVPEPIVAIEVGMLDQVPPPVMSVNVPVVPAQIVAGPVGTAGRPFTVTV